MRGSAGTNEVIEMGRLPFQLDALEPAGTMTPRGVLDMSSGSSGLWGAIENVSRKWGSPTMVKVG